MQQTIRNSKSLNTKVGISREEIKKNIQELRALLGKVDKV
jgi:biotin operon repressor